jgi:hyperpolarization activated cyclic nucleotide-gated potassium channel 2
MYGTRRNTIVRATSTGLAKLDHYCAVFETPLSLGHHYIEDLGPWVFTHWSILRRIWEYLTILFALMGVMEVLYVIVVIENAPFPEYWVSFVFDIFFVFDNIVIRRTAFMSSTDFIQEPPKITRAYGRVPMWIHNISLVPLGWIGIIIHNRWVYLPLSIGKLLRLLRGYRALVTTYTLLPYCGVKWHFLPLIYAFIFAAHFFTCVMMGVADSESLDSSFLAYYEARGFTRPQLYFVCLHFVLTAMMSVGFAHLEATTLLETIVILSVEVFGVVWQVILMSVLVAAMIDPDRAEAVHDAASVQRYLRSRNVECRRAVREYAEYVWETARGIGDLRSMLKSLPLTIRNSLKFELAGDYFRRSPTFQDLTPAQLVYISDDLAHETFTPGEVLCEQGRTADRMFLFRGGVVSVEFDGREIAKQRCDGQMQCELDAIGGRGNSLTIRAVSYVEVWVYRLEKLVELLKKRSDIRMVVLDKFQKIAPTDFNEILATLVPDPEVRHRVLGFNRRRRNRPGGTGRADMELVGERQKRRSSSQHEAVERPAVDFPSVGLDDTSSDDQDEEGDWVDEGTAQAGDLVDTGTAEELPQTRDTTDGPPSA